MKKDRSKKQTGSDADEFKEQGTLNEEQQGYQQEEQDEDEGAKEEGVEEGEEDTESSEKLNFDDLISKAKKYLKDNVGEVEDGAVLKYASIAVLAVLGIRKSGLLGGIVVSVAVGLLAKYLLEKQQENSPSMAAAQE